MHSISVEELEKCLKLGKPSESREESMHSIILDCSGERRISREVAKEDKDLHERTEEKILADKNCVSNCKSEEEHSIKRDNNAIC